MNPRYGLYRAQVASTADATGAGRVSIMVPSLALNGVWALTCGTPPGPGDNVIVGFEGGDVTRPVVLGSVRGH